MQYNSNYCMNGDLNLTKSGIGKLVNKRYVNLQIKCDWMNKKCWKFALFVAFLTNCSNFEKSMLQFVLYIAKWR